MRSKILLAVVSGALMTSMFIPTGEVPKYEIYSSEDSFRRSSSGVDYSMPIDFSGDKNLQGMGQSNEKFSADSDLNLLKLKTVNNNKYLEELFSLYEESSKGKLDTYKSHLSVKDLLARHCTESGFYVGTPFPKSYIPYTKGVGVLWGEDYTLPSGVIIPGKKLTLRNLDSSVINSYSEGVDYKLPFTVNGVNSIEGEAYRDVNCFQIRTTRFQDSEDPNSFVDQLRYLNRAESSTDYSNYFGDQVLSKEQRIIISSIIHNGGEGRVWRLFFGVDKKSKLKEFNKVEAYKSLNSYWQLYNQGKKNTLIYKDLITKNRGPIRATIICMYIKGGYKFNREDLQSIKSSYSFVSEIPSLYKKYYNKELEDSDWLIDLSQKEKDILGSTEFGSGGALMIKRTSEDIGVYGDYGGKLSAINFITLEHNILALVEGEKAYARLLIYLGDSSVSIENPSTYLLVTSGITYTDTGLSLSQIKLSSLEGVQKGLTFFYNKGLYGPFDEIGYKDGIPVYAQYLYKNFDGYIYQVKGGTINLPRFGCGIFATTSGLIGTLSEDELSGIFGTSNINPSIVGKYITDHGYGAVLDPKNPNDVGAPITSFAFMQDSGLNPEYLRVNKLDLSNLSKLIDYLKQGYPVISFVRNINSSAVARTYRLEEGKMVDEKELKITGKTHFILLYDVINNNNNYYVKVIDSGTSSQKGMNERYALLVDVLPYGQRTLDVIIMKRPIKALGSSEENTVQPSIDKRDYEFNYEESLSYLLSVDFISEGDHPGGYIEDIQVESNSILVTYRGGSSKYVPGILLEFNVDILEEDTSKEFPLSDYRDSLLEVSPVDIVDNKVSIVDSGEIE